MTKWTIVGLCAMSAALGCGGDGGGGQGGSGGCPDPNCCPECTVGAGGASGGAGGQGGQGATGGGGGGQGGSASTTGVGGGMLFPCGEQMCDSTTQFCMESSGGPCCEPPSYTCVDLPASCPGGGIDCACFDQADCPCGGGGPCDGGSGIGQSCDAESGGLTFHCAYP